MQSAIGDRLAKELLAGRIHDGDEVIVDLDEDSDSLTVRSATGSDAYPASVN